MGSSTKKKKEKKKDFQKAKLKVGKARPKNTNATDTSFSAKSIVFKQQTLRESGRDAKALFEHHLSLLSSRNDAQRRDALQYLTTATAAVGAAEDLPQPVSAIVSRAQPLMLDGNPQVRHQLLRLLRTLPASQLGSLDRLLLHTRAGMAHLSDSIRFTSLDVLDWLLEMNGEAVVSCAGGWVKTLRTFQNLLSWHRDGAGVGVGAVDAKWSHSRSAAATANPGGTKLLVRQLGSLGRLLYVGLRRQDPAALRAAEAERAAKTFPLWHASAYAIPGKSNPFGYLNLFDAPRDVESEMYADAEERAKVFDELGLVCSFWSGVKEAKKEAGEVGRAAAGVEKGLRLVEAG